MMVPYRCQYHCSCSFEDSEALAKHYGEVWYTTENPFLLAGVFVWAGWLRLGFHAILCNSKEILVIPAQWVPFEELAKALNSQDFSLEEIRLHLLLAQGCS